MYIPKEAVSGTDLTGRTYTKRGYLAGKRFDPTKHKYFPLPIDEILNSQKEDTRL